MAGLIFPSLVRGMSQENSFSQLSMNSADSTVNELDRELNRDASHIVIGTVERVESKWDEAERTIYSYANMSVENYSKGEPLGSQITVRYKGGEVGNIGLAVSSEPKFELGERAKLFLKPLPEPGTFNVVGHEGGKITIDASASAGYTHDGYHWIRSDLPVQHYINENGTPDVPGKSEEFAAVQASFQTWENDVGSYMDYTYAGTTSLSGASKNGVNVVSWQSIDGVGGTLAETFYWYEVSTRALSEFDIVFDEDDTWTASVEFGKHDIQNVGTHEVGHTLVLNDLYDPADSEQTMYGYSYLGETKKRTLYTGDIAGIRYIYGLSTITYTVDTSPTGLQIEVDGINYTAPYSFSWFPGSDHYVKAISPQSPEPGTRSIFESWSDGGTQTHVIRAGVGDASITAQYRRQYRTSIKFITDDDAMELHPDKIKIIGSTPNTTLLTLESYSNVWLDDAQWTILEIQWQGNNIVPSNHPFSSISADFEWIVKSRVYPISFNDSFKDREVQTLQPVPSSFILEFSNGTLSGRLNPSLKYYLQNGTTSWHSVIWQNAEVVPPNTDFDASEGIPTINLLVYDFSISVKDILDIPVQGASIMVTLPNGTQVYTSTRPDGLAVLRKVPRGDFTARISYIGQTVTIAGNVDSAAEKPAEAKISTSIPIILIIAVTIILVVAVAIVVRRKRAPISKLPQAS